MAESLDHEIAAAREAVSERERLEAALVRARAALKLEQEKERALRARASTEHEDVERLEGLTLTRLFQTVLGAREERLDQERREYLAARLRLDTARAAVADLAREAADLKDRVAALGEADARLRDVLRRKEQALAAAGGERSRALLELAEALGVTRSRAREVAEAYLVGMEALNGLKGIEAELDDARGWGTVDMVSWNGVAALVKHQHMDRAADLARQVQSQLRRFEGEVAEVRGLPAGDLAVSLGDFTRFADLFFDSLIVDWQVQSKIDSALKRVRGTRTALRDLLTRLEMEIARSRTEEERLEAERVRLIETA